MKNSKKQLIPRPLRVMVRRLYDDGLDRLLNRQNELLPPRRLISGIDRAGFKQIGEEFLRYFIELCQLQPNAQVLEVGCGNGRMAIPLTGYLNDKGHYEGFDVIQEGIYWCQQKITPRYSNFHRADVYNKSYNPEGKHKASDYRFPYRDESFDFVFLTSVFTHMLPQDMENYLLEIARVLKPAGKCLITFFLLHPESLERVEAQTSSITFDYKFENYRVKDKNTPEDAIAYDEKFIRELYRKCKLDIMEPIHYGSWYGSAEFLSYQDIVVAVK